MRYLTHVYEILIVVCLKLGITGHPLFIVVESDNAMSLGTQSIHNAAPAGEISGSVLLQVLSKDLGQMLFSDI